MKRQAERANKAQVDLHIVRNRKLGEKAINDNDNPRKSELLVTLALILLVIGGSLLGWW